MAKPLDQLVGVVGFRFLTSCALLLALTGGTAFAQQAPPVQQGAGTPQAPIATFRSAVEVVTISASVKTRGGKAVRDLQQADFEVLDSGVPVALKDFYAGESAISLAVLLDISGSMAVAGNINRAREAVTMAAMNLRNNSDEVALFTFDSELREVIDFTTDLTVFDVSISRASPGASRRCTTPSAPPRAASRNARTSTGRCSSSPTAWIPAAASRLPRYRESPAPSMCRCTCSRWSALSITPMVNSRPSPTKRGACCRPRSWIWRAGPGRHALCQRAQPYVGGAAEHPGELRHQYLLTFEPGARRGWHPLEVRVKKRNLVVHARGGYMAGSRAGS
jgi:hypothetical protein